MVTLALSPALLHGQRDPAVGAGLTDDQWDRLREASLELLQLVTPLTHVTSHPTLEELLTVSLDSYVAIMDGMLRTLLTSEHGWEFVNTLTRRMTHEIEAAIDAKVDAFDAEALTRFRGAASSMAGLTTWALDKLAKGGVDAQRAAMIAGLIGNRLLRAQIAFAAVVAIMADKVPDWHPEALELLCAVADDYMTDIEDTFLALRIEPIVEAELVEYHEHG